jgi:hypothetical protein
MKNRPAVLSTFTLAWLAVGLWAPEPASEQSQQAAVSPLPAIPQLMREVVSHQKQLEKVRENYTYSATVTTQYIDAAGQVKKTETEEQQIFFVNGHPVERTVKKNGQVLSGHSLDKETERMTKLVEKAEKTPSDQPLEGQEISVGRLLKVMDVRNQRRESYRGRSAIVFDFVGRRDAQTHGLAEDASKKLQGTLWVDEADRQIAHLDAVFNDNFHIGVGIVANVQRGSNFHFDQALVNGEVWLPTGAEGTVQVRVLLVKSYRQHVVERNYDYKRFSVEAEQGKGAKVAGAK